MFDDHFVTKLCYWIFILIYENYSLIKLILLYIVVTKIRTFQVHIYTYIYLFCHFLLKLILLIFYILGTFTYFMKYVIHLHIVYISYQCSESSQYFHKQLSTSSPFFHSTIPHPLHPLSFHFCWLCPKSCLHWVLSNICNSFIIFCKWVR